MKSLLQCPTRLSSQPLMHTRTEMSSQARVPDISRHTWGTLQPPVQSSLQTDVRQGYHSSSLTNILHGWTSEDILIELFYTCGTYVCACLCGSIQCGRVCTYVCVTTDMTVRCLQLLSLWSHWNSILIRLGWPTREPWRSPGKHFPDWEISPNSNITVFILHPNPHNSPLTS